MSASHASASTHFNDSGEAHMVDITAKSPTAREAIASSAIQMNVAAAEAIRTGGSRKGDVLAVARLAAIGAAKWTSTLIPLCHGIPIEGVEVDFHWEENGTDSAHPPRPEASRPSQREGDESCTISTGAEASQTLHCRATVRTTYKTGVEMEAMTAASLAALTVYDMLKSVDRAMVIVETRLESKKGGKSGVFSRR